jgi:iron-sulfur cluster assembly accessory protein
MNITITETAKKVLKSISQSSNFKKPALRLVISGAGCGGPRLGLALEELEKSKDFLFTENDIDVLLDKDMKKFIEEGEPVIIDYLDSPYRTGFMINNSVKC